MTVRIKALSLDRATVYGSTELAPITDVPMKLLKVTKTDPIERLAVGIHKSVHDDLKTYQVFYKSNTQEEIPMGMMVEEMLKRFLAEDKDFQKFKAPATK